MKTTEFYGANLSTLIDCAIAADIFNGVDLSLYTNRCNLIDRIAKRLESDEFNAICTLNGTTFEKTFTPGKK